MNRKLRETISLLFIGPQWHGSDSTALARGFRKLGHAVFTVDDDGYLPQGNTLPLRLFRRAFRRTLERDYNAAIVKAARTMRPGLLLVYKGANVWPETIEAAKECGAYATCFYPDVSMTGHGENIPKCMPLYDWVFTSKSFGIRDLREQFGVLRCELLHHGVDLECHRPMAIDNTTARAIMSDCCFIGGWSPKKEKLLVRLVQRMPNVNLRIWCANWRSRGCKELQPFVVGEGIFGDAYAAAIQCTKINLGLLSEVYPGASSGDQVTSRTFQIPACGGFMLHERNEELAEFFREGEEVACFDGGDELADKVAYYLDHDEERDRIRLAGYQRCVAEDGSERRAQRIIEHYRSRNGASAPKSRDVPTTP